MSALGLTINYQTKNKAKFISFLEKFQSENDLIFDIKNIEAYHKLPGQFQAIASLETGEKTDANLVYFCLLLANKFKTDSNGKLNIIGPNPSNTGICFEVILNQEADHFPLKWLHIQTT